MTLFLTTAIASRRCVGVMALIVVLLAGATASAPSSPDHRATPTHNGAAPDIAIRRIVLDHELWRTDPTTEPYFRHLSRVLFDPVTHEYFVFDGGTTTFHVFSSTGVAKQTLELHGDGPGLARGVVDTRLLPDGQIGLLTAMGPTVVRVRRNGEAVYDQPSITPFYSDTQSLSCSYFFDYHDGHFVLSGQQAVPGRSFLATYDPQGGLRNELLDLPAHSQVGQGFFDDHDDFLVCYKPWTLASNGLIYHSVQRNGDGQYEIRAVDLDGRVALVTSRQYEPRRRTDREIDETKAAHFGGYDAYLDFVDYGFDVVIPDIEPDIVRIEELGGRLWVETGRSRDDGDAVVYDVFELDGGFVEQVAVSCLTRSIGRDALFFCGDTIVLGVGTYDASLGSLGDSHDDLALRCYAFDHAGAGSGAQP